MRIERADPGLPTNERDFQARIISTDRGREGIAVRLGWDVLHVKPAAFIGDPARPERKRFVTPTSGSLGSGWPDLILVRGSRMIAAELKAGRNKPTVEQLEVLRKLAAAGAETYLWYPTDWDAIVGILGGREPCGECKGPAAHPFHGPVETCRGMGHLPECPNPTSHHAWRREDR